MHICNGFMVIFKWIFKISHLISNMENTCICFQQLFKISWLKNNTYLLS